MPFFSNKQCFSGKSLQPPLAQVKNFLSKESVAGANPVETFTTVVDVLKEADRMYTSQPAEYDFMFMKDLL